MKKWWEINRNQNQNLHHHRFDREQPVVVKVPKRKFLFMKLIDMICAVTGSFDFTPQVQLPCVSASWFSGILCDYLQKESLEILPFAMTSTESRYIFSHLNTMENMGSRFQRVKRCFKKNVRCKRWLCVSDLDAKTSAHCNRILVVTEVIRSGIQYIAVCLRVTFLAHLSYY